MLVAEAVEHLGTLLEKWCCLRDVEQQPEQKQRVGDTPLIAESTVQGQGLVGEPAGCGLVSPLAIQRSRSIEGASTRRRRSRVVSEGNLEALSAFGVMGALIPELPQRSDELQGELGGTAGLKPVECGA